MKRLLGKFIARKMANVEPGKFLDQMITGVEAKKPVGTETVFPSPEASARRPFSSDMLFPDTGFSKMKFHQFKRLVKVNPRLMMGMKRSARYYKDTFQPKVDTISAEMLAELETLARSKGAVDISYLRNIDPGMIFQGKSLPHPHAIVFTVEMDRDEMSTAPSFDAFNEVSKGYLKLAKTANAITEFLRKNGFAAYPGTALGGISDYSIIGEKAGLGAVGYHGLLITPDQGARVRISTIYTNIANLPERKNEHEWIRDFCSSCRKCVRSCPPAAIHLEPQPKPNGQKECIEVASCRNYFMANWGCAVCLKVCPFSEIGYDEIKKGMDRKEHLPSAPMVASAAELPKKRVSVVGAGPAGFYVAESLLKQAPNIEVDLLERLPVPHGLVRFGVAPDHPEVKSKAWAYDRILDDPRIRFIGNVTYGQDVTLDEMKKFYDATVFSVGAPSHRSLGIPGEDLTGSFSGAEFVNWYNGHPDFSDFKPPMAAKSVAIIGLGNVALDVARMLFSDDETLHASDMADYAVEALSQMDVEEIHIFGRRGPSQAGFTPKELQELADVPGVQIIVSQDDLAKDIPLESGSDQAMRRSVRNVELFKKYADSASASAPAAKRVYIHFFSSPAEIIGKTGEVSQLRIEKTKLVKEQDRISTVDTGEFDTYDVQAVIRSVGFRSVALPDVPFDDKKSVIPTVEGRIVDNTGKIVDGLYASGWVRRGPTGVIGTNKVDAEEVVQSILKDLKENSGTKEGNDIVQLLQQKKVRIVSKDDWKALRKEERRSGSLAGRKAIKFTKVDKMLTFLDQ